MPPDTTGMGDFSVDNLAISTTWLIAAAGLLFAIIVYMLRGMFAHPIKFIRGRLTRQLRGEAEQAYEDLCMEIESVRQKYNILNAYSNEYLKTFQSAGWDELLIYIEDLQITQSSLCLLLERERYEEARDVCHFLLGTLSLGESQQLIKKFEGLESLAGWRQQCRELLARVVHAGMEAAKKTASLGVARKRPTKPTLVTLAELRDALSESQ